MIVTKGQTRMEKALCYDKLPCKIIFLYKNKTNDIFRQISYFLQCKKAGSNN